MRASSRSPRIAGAGVCCLDSIFVAPAVVPGGTGPVKDFHVKGGGLVAAALVAAGKLGAHTALFGMVGDDETGDRVLEGLDAHGVSTNGVARIAGGASPWSLVHIDEDTGERTIFHRAAQDLAWPGAGLDGLGEADVLLIDDYYPDLAVAAATVARERDLRVVADMVPGEQNQHLLVHVDVLIAPSDVLRLPGIDGDTGKALDAIRSARRRVPVAANGEPDSVAGPYPSPEEEALHQERTSQVDELMGRLSPEDQQIAFLHFFEEMPYRRVSAVLGIPTGTLKYRVHRIRHQLREERENR